MSAFVAACGGFLLAVLWMDLMFDVQVLRHADRTRPLPDDVLDSIASYYRRVTRDARPMTYLVGVVMAALVIGLSFEILAGRRWTDIASIFLCGGPVLLAALRVFPNAVRLASRSDTPMEQSRLARAICRDHLLCLASITGLLVVRLFAV
jgi:hypothetical protein